MKPWRTHPWIFLVLVTVATTLVYWDSLGNPFQIDDAHTIVDNPHIRDAKKIPHMFVSADYFSLFSNRTHYRPVLVSSIALNHAWNGPDPIAFRVVNLILHLLGIWAVYALVKKLFVSIPIALISATLFALHPFQSEVVNYISARSSSMATLFFVLAVYLFLLFREFQESGKGYIKTGSVYFLFLLSFCLSLLSKEISLTLVGVLLMADLTVIPPRSRQDLLKKSVVYLPFILVAVFFVFRIDLFGFLAKVQFAPIAAQAQVLFYTPRLLLFPAGLAADHPILGEAGLSHPQVLMTLLILLALLAIGMRLAMASGQWERGMSFLVLWFFMTSLPTTLFPLNQAFVEHRGYLPSVGLIPLMAVGIERLWGLSKRYSSPLLKWGLTGMGVIVLGLYVIQIEKRNQAWSDPVNLWTDAVAKHPDSKLGRLFLADSHQKKGNQERAIELLTGLLADDPDCRHLFSCSKAHLYLANIYEHRGRIDNAAREYRITLALVPDSYLVRYRLGVIHQKKGDLAGALKFYQEALEKNPKAHEVHYALGTVFEIQKKYDQAEQHYEVTLERVPADLKARTRLATVLLQKGMPDQAAQEFFTVLVQDPRNAQVHRGLGFIYESQGKSGQALEHYMAAIEYGSDDPGFRYHLGEIYLKSGNKEMAKQHWEQAIRQAPDFLQARLNLATLFRQEGQKAEAMDQYRQILPLVSKDPQYRDLKKRVESDLHRLEKEK